MLVLGSLGIPQHMYQVLKPNLARFYRFFAFFMSYEGFLVEKGQIFDNKYFLL